MLSEMPKDKDKDIGGQFFSRQNRWTLIISVIGIILFISITTIFSFKDKLLSLLYPKPVSRATVCSGGSKVPSNRAGFVFTGGDLEQAISALNTPLYYTYDLNLGPQKSIFVIGKYVQNQADPLGLRLLMENNLSNVDFKGLPGQTPVGWAVAADSDSTVSVDTAPQNTIGGRTSVHISNGQNSAASQISQVFKKPVSAGQVVIFGVWVKTASSADVKVVVQNSQSPNQEFGAADTTRIEPNRWTYIVGYGKVPEGATNSQLVLGVLGGGKRVWFDGAAAAVVSSDQNQTMTDLVLKRCGAAWMIDDGPGWEESSSAPFMKPLPIDLYSLIYYQYYTLIKNTDPSAKVLPGGLMGAPVVFDKKGGYSPQAFLDSFRTSYKNFFSAEPPIDALAIRYLASDQNRWDGSSDLENYLSKLRTYMDQVPGWNGKPIWVSRLGVSKNAPKEGVDFIQAAMKFLTVNNLNIEKWFWYDTCGFNAQMSPLFLSSNKICSWPMKLSSLGEAYLAASIVPTPTPSGPTPAPTATPAGVSVATPSAIVTPTPIPSGPTAEGTSSASLKEGTSSGTSQ